MSNIGRRTSALQGGEYVRGKETPVSGYIFKHEDGTFELWNFQGLEITGLKIDDIGLCSQTLSHTWNSQRYLKDMQQVLQALAVCGLCGSQKVSLKLEDKRWGDYLATITCDSEHTETRPVIGQKSLGAPWTCELCEGTDSKNWYYTEDCEYLNLPSTTVLKLTDGTEVKEFSIIDSHRLCERCFERNKEAMASFEKDIEQNSKKYEKQEKDERRQEYSQMSKEELVEKIIELEDMEYD